jgi:hypothetical protein
LIYQIRWATEPGLRGISCCEFCAIPIATGAKADNEGGVAVDFASDAERDAFLRQLEENFSTRRFANAADAFDTVKAFAGELLNRSQS